MPSDSGILAEFPSNNNGPKEEDEVVIYEPPPKRPSKQELCDAIAVLQTLSLSVEVYIDSFKSNLRNISRIIDSNRLVEKLEAVLTDFFSKKVTKSHELCTPTLFALPSLPMLLCFVLFHVTLRSDCIIFRNIVPFQTVIKI